MKIIARLFAVTLMATQFFACGIIEPLEEKQATSHPITLTTASVSAAITSAGGASESKTSVETTTTTINQTGVGMVRFQDTWGTKEVTIDLGTFDRTTDFGYDGVGNGNGSITLTADTLNYPYSGGAYPVLTSFYVIDDNTSTTIINFVNIKPACATGGMWICTGGSCDANSNCSVTTTGAGSSFFSRDDWDQHQFPPYGYTSVNSFPRCDSGVGGWTGCPASHNSLPSGHYYAKYLLMSDRGVGVSTGTADLRVKVTVKKDIVARNQGTSNGVINLNVILVGDKNINDSKTAKGIQNLNLLFEEVNRILKNGSTNISIGEIQTYNVSDANGGDYYAEVDYSLLGDLFSGTSGFPAIDEGKYINVFMVRDIEISGVGYSILGLAGAIMGPPVNGTQSSGLAFSTNVSGGPQGVLSEFNSTCTAPGACARNSQDSNFLEMGATIAHEIGHYLGLNHPSEKVATLAETQRHDQIVDTPTCAPRTGPNLDQRSCYLDTATQLGTSRCSVACDAAIVAGGVVGGVYYNGASKTTNFCAAVPECQFNHVMWYTTKLRQKVSGAWREDGNQISSQSSALIQWNPFVQ